MNCIFCGKEDDLYEIKGEYVCSSCYTIKTSVGAWEFGGGKKLLSLEMKIAKLERRILELEKNSS